VCHLWRDVALDTAILWTDIRIRLRDDCMFSRSSLFRRVFGKIKIQLIDISYNVHYDAPYTRSVETIMVENNSYLLLFMMDLFKEVAAPLLGFPPWGDNEILENEPHALFTGGTTALLRSVQLNSTTCLMQPQFTQLTSFTLRMPNNAMDLWRLPSLYTPCLQRLYMKDVDYTTLETFRTRFFSSDLSTFESLKLDFLGPIRCSAAKERWLEILSMNGVITTQEETAN
jgi:hypothetical protein